MILSESHSQVPTLESAGFCRAGTDEHSTCEPLRQGSGPGQKTWYCSSATLAHSAGHDLEMLHHGSCARSLVVESRLRASLRRFSANRLDAKFGI